jgi:hypothetical protein
MNQQKFGEAATMLDTPLASGSAPGAEAARASEPVIGTAAAEIINSSMPLAQQLSGAQMMSLTPEERAQILDAQATLLRGSIQRRQKQPAAAAQSLNSALADLLAIRDGRVTSIARLRSQGLNELALLAEERSDFPLAEQQLRQAIDVLAIEYPESVAVSAANARLAAYFARRGASGCVDRAVPRDRLARRRRCAVDQHLQRHARALFRAAGTGDPAAAGARG